MTMQVYLCYITHYIHIEYDNVGVLCHITDVTQHTRYILSMTMRVCCVT